MRNFNSCAHNCYCSLMVSTVEVSHHRMIEIVFPDKIYPPLPCCRHVQNETYFWHDEHLLEFRVRALDTCKIIKHKFSLTFRRPHWTHIHVHTHTSGFFFGLSHCRLLEYVQTKTELCFPFRTQNTALRPTTCASRFCAFHLPMLAQNYVV